MFATLKVAGAHPHCLAQLVDSVAPARSALQAFGFAKFLSRFPKLFKSELFSFCPFTQRSRSSPVQLGPPTLV